MIIVFCQWIIQISSGKLENLIFDEILIRVSDEVSFEGIGGSDNETS